MSSEDQELAYQIIFKGLRLKDADERERTDYHKYLDEIEKNATARGKEDLVALVTVFRKYDESSLQTTLDDIPEVYKPLLLQVIPGGPIGYTGNVSGEIKIAGKVIKVGEPRLAGDETTDAPPPKPKRKPK